MNESRQAAAVESLEPRQFLDATLANGVLRIDGTREADTVRVTRDGGSLVVTLNDDPAERFARKGVRSVRFEGGRGNDSFRLEVDRPAMLLGGAGNDTLVASDGNDSIAGGGGKDLLRGRNGNDSINGNDGNDTLLGADGDDVLNSGDGRDLVEGSAGNDQLNGGGGRDTLRGGAGTDLATGADETLADGDAADRLGGGGFGGGGNGDGSGDGDGTGGGGGDPPVFGGGNQPPVFGGGNGGIFG